jgi:hypothetical protein
MGLYTHYIMFLPLPSLQFMKSCSNLFMFSDTTHVSLKPPEAPVPSVGELLTPSDPLEGETDLNSTLHEATQKTLRLDSVAGEGDDVTDVKMASASPEKSGAEGGQEGGCDEEVVDVGGGEHVHRQRLEHPQAIHTQRLSIHRQRLEHPYARV